MRNYKRAIELGDGARPEIAHQVGMEPAELEAMFRMVAIADYDQRYVIPQRHGELSPTAFAEQGTRGIDFVSGGAAPALEVEPDPSDANFDLRGLLTEVPERGRNGNGKVDRPMGPGLP